MENSTFSRNEKSLYVETTEANTQELTPTRIAVYDDFLSAPRIIDINPSEISQYIEDISSKTYELAQQKGSSIPYTVIREVCENFIHAQFKDPCISILDGGNTIKFTDQGPGIEDKQRAQNPGFTSATSEMRQYIRGVGSGFPIVRDYLRFSNGRLIIEDNIKEGTVVTIQIDASTKNQDPIVYRDTPKLGDFDIADLTQRDYNVLSLAEELGAVGPTDVKQNLNIPVATAQRCLDRLESAGFLTRADNSKKRMLTDAGLSLLDR